MIYWIKWQTREDGMLEIEIGPDSSMIFEEKQLDF